MRQIGVPMLPQFCSGVEVELTYQTAPVRSLKKSYIWKNKIIGTTFIDNTTLVPVCSGHDLCRVSKGSLKVSF